MFAAGYLTAEQAKPPEMDAGSLLVDLAAVSGSSFCYQLAAAQYVTFTILDNGPFLSKPFLFHNRAGMSRYRYQHAIS